jgi:hypothetical protein
LVSSGLRARPWPSQPERPAAGHHARCNITCPRLATVASPASLAVPSPKQKRHPPVSAWTGDGTRRATRIASDTGLATCARHWPSGGRSLGKQRTVNPLIAQPFPLVTISSLSFKAGPVGSLRPPSVRQPCGGHRGTDPPSRTGRGRPDVPRSQSHRSRTSLPIPVGHMGSDRLMALEDVHPHGPDRLACAISQDIYLRDIPEWLILPIWVAVEGGA